VHAAWCLWLLGRWQRATAMMADALTWARDADHPFTLAYACHFAASFHECRRDPEAARAVAEEAERHSTEFALLASVGAIHRGWLDGDVALIAAGVDAYRATGSRFGLPTYLGLLAEAHERTGEAETGLAIVADARRVADDTGAHYWDAELARLHGALLLARGGARPRGRATAAANAEAAFRDALAIATAQGARALALRAATSLARLWQERGQHADAHTLLAGACLGFDADATAPDLRDARALLAATAGHTTGAR
jgi:adenylate cyclase